MTDFCGSTRFLTILKDTGLDEFFKKVFTEGVFPLSFRHSTPHSLCFNDSLLKIRTFGYDFVNSAIEHVFAVQKEQLGIFIRTIGLKRANVKIALPKF